MKQGKWRVNTILEYIEKHSGKQTLVLSNDRIIAETFGATLEEAEANARLIASAPELLEACKNLYNQIKQAQEGMGQFESPTLNEALLKTQQAIAKVGETERING